MFTGRGIQNYITVPVLNRSNHDIILPPNTSIEVVNQVLSITPIEQIHITEKEKGKLTAKNYHRMAAKHRIRDESISKGKKNSNENNIEKILEEIDLYHIYQQNNIRKQWI